MQNNIYLFKLQIPSRLKLSLFFLTHSSEFLILKKKGALCTNMVCIPSQLLFCISAKKNLSLSFFFSLNKKNLNEKNQIDKNILYITAKLLNSFFKNSNIPSTKEIQLAGFGFKTYLSKSGKTLGLKLGYSHKLYITAKKLQKFFKIERYFLKVFSSNSFLAGKVASDIQKFKKPDAYKGKGIQFPGVFLKLKIPKKSQER